MWHPPGTVAAMADRFPRQAPVQIMVTDGSPGAWGGSCSVGVREEGRQGETLCVWCGGSSRGAAGPPCRELCARGPLEGLDAD